LHGFAYNLWTAAAAIREGAGDLPRAINRF
jgi:hypothetical protein